MASSTGGVPAIEIGTLTATSPDESQFIGSSSGIFFVNTVQRAFASSKNLSPQDASPAQQYGPVETCIVGHESRDRDQHNAETSSPRSFPSSSRTYGIPALPLEVPPSRELAKELIIVYFRVWHPLFPFLHGPTFVQDVEACYADVNAAQVNTRRKNCQATIFQCIFNIAALDSPGFKLPPECTISSATTLSSHLSSLATRHDIPTLQSLLAGQLYLIATMSLHAASTIGALIMRLILHGGFHRCPCRYAQLSTHDANVRKRIFWSAYVTDRYLSQALGLPLGIQDSDIDVCTPGMTELHQPAPRLVDSGDESRTEVSLHLPRSSPDSSRYSLGDPDTSSTIHGDPTTARTETSGISNRHGEDALENHVAYGKLTGRALEMFHKSITARFAEYDDVLELTSDIHSFWNALPQHLQDLPSLNRQVTSDQSSEPSRLGLYFTIIYQQLILLINRPFLSLEPSSARFRSSMQACIGASRTVISTLQKQTIDGTCTSWPGTLSVTWMSGLILAFACALDIYPTAKGLPEIQTCLELLSTMRTKWTAACHCHSALKLLLNDLSSKSGQGIGSLNTQKRQYNRTSANAPISKRQRMNVISSDRDLEVPRQAQVQNLQSPTVSTHLSYDNNAGFQTYSDAGQNPWTQGQMYDHAQPCPNCPQDMFGHLSWESLIQNNGPSYDFWSNDLPEV